MKYIDITHVFNGLLPIWPGDALPEFDHVDKISEGSDANVHYIRMGMHMGTHVDAPYHFVEEGKKLLDMGLQYFLGDCLVVDCACKNGRVEIEDLEGAVTDGTERLLLKTPNSRRPYHGAFNREYCAVSPSAAQWLAEKNIKCIGIDYNSIGPLGPDGILTHKILLGGDDRVIIEGLNLSSTEPGYYTLCCLPLKIAGVEGAPARVILISE